MAYTCTIKAGNYRENSIFANSVKIYICVGKNPGLGHDLPISENDRVILAFRDGFNFHETSHMRSFAKIKSSRKFSKIQ